MKRPFGKEAEEDILYEHEIVCFSKDIELKK